MESLWVQSGNCGTWLRYYSPCDRLRPWPFPHNRLDAPTSLHRRSGITAASSKKREEQRAPPPAIAACRRGTRSPRGRRKVLQTAHKDRLVHLF
ncbi:hypothetical protein M407DRAFT_156486 [Tulasnella calospora MUT 4182]|uniref:Uncharacterized protein n=1 Tax=Tulasnella calospora MUT 4182 TaxID=1051891 RepID=A0A0C3QR46_9AGAM|nr:hypothetical protein M407DRAFT_156486 [Tulasnella calospora MUT 4182]